MRIPSNGIVAAGPCGRRFWASRELPSHAGQQLIRVGGTISGEGIEILVMRRPPNSRSLARPTISMDQFPRHRAR